MQKPHRKFGDDPRVYSIMSKEFLQDENGKLSGYRHR